MELMKRKLPIGIENFEDIVKENFYYMIKATKGKYFSAYATSP